MNSMNSNEKIYVKSYTAYTTEDVFDRGEVGITRCAWTSSDNRIEGVFNTIEDALEEVCLKWDLGKPIWFDANIAEFQRHARTRFGKDNFVEETEFDYLEIQVIDED